MSDHPVNVGETERLAAGVLAGALIVATLRRPTPLRFIAVGCLLYRALSGHCYGYEWLGASTCKVKP
jgi:hypothetical protein